MEDRLRRAGNKQPKRRVRLSAGGEHSAMPKIGSGLGTTGGSRWARFKHDFQLPVIHKEAPGGSIGAPFPNRTLGPLRRMGGTPAVSAFLRKQLEVTHHRK
jgi:hypothetical protein